MLSPTAEPDDATGASIGSFQARCIAASQLVVDGANPDGFRAAL
jgi:hypothetical protein